MRNSGQNINTASAFLRILRILISDITQGKTRKYYRKLSQKYRYQKEIANSLLKPEFCKRIDLDERLERYRTLRYGDYVDTPNNEQLKLLRNPGMIPVALDRWDRLGSEFGIELRHPFLDIDFVNFCLSLPWQLKHHEGWSKWILRYSYKEQLPTEIVWRKGKEHLGWNTTLRFLESNIDEVEHLISDSENTIYDYVCWRKLRSVWQRFKSTGSDLDAYQLNQVYCLAQWLQAEQTR